MADNKRMRTGRVDAGKAKYINVRKSPSKNGEAIGQLSKNDTFEIIGESGDYYKIVFQHYKTAYVAKHLVAEE